MRIRYGWIAVALTACAGSETTPDTGPAPVDAGPSDAGRLDSGTPPDAGRPIDAGPSALDESLAAVLAALDVPVTPLSPLSAPDEAQVELGWRLFFDPILSGNRDVACSSCHQAENGTGDALPLALGTGAEGRGPARADGPRPAWGRRHTPDLWNRGRLDKLYWDGRVSATATVGPPAPAGIDDPLALQALQPILDPIEMLGEPGDIGVGGVENELAGRAPEDVYAALEARLTAIEGYRSLFAAAYGTDEVTMGRIVTALAAYERDRFDPTDTPWDRYLRGDLSALNDAAKLGATVFFGAAQCVNCHEGALLSDGALHNIGVPLLEPIDEGADRFAFRTPPLRNAAASPPYMHNGTLGSLQDILRHYSNPERTAEMYDGEGLPDDLTARVVTDPAEVERLHDTLSDDLPLAGSGSTPVGLSNVRQFLLHLVDEGSVARALEAPDAVPSGLTVGGL